MRKVEMSVKRKLCLLFPLFFFIRPSLLCSDSVLCSATTCYRPMSRTDRESRCSEGHSNREKKQRISGDVTDISVASDSLPVRTGVQVSDSRTQRFFCSR